MKKITDSKGRNWVYQSSDMIAAAIECDEDLGFCIKCGAEHGGIEPDARQYPCEECGERRVYGAEEILLLGAYYTDTPPVTPDTATTPPSEAEAEAEADDTPPEEA